MVLMIQGMEYKSKSGYQGLLCLIEPIIPYISYCVHIMLGLGSCIVRDSMLYCHKRKNNLILFFQLTPYQSFL